MKKYITIALGIFLTHFFLHTYLFSVGTLRITEGNTFSWLLPTLFLSFLSLPIDSAFLLVDSLFSLWLFKNKLEKNWVFLIMVLIVTGAFSLFLQIMIAQQIFNLVSVVKPIALMFLGGLVMIVSSGLFVIIQSSKEKVEAVVYGAFDTVKDLVESFEEKVVVVSNLKELSKSLETYVPKTYILVDSTEAEILQIIKILEYEDTKVLYLYTSEDEPKFNKERLKSWEESHGFISGKLSDLLLSKTFRKIGRRFVGR